MIPSSRRPATKVVLSPLPEWRPAVAARHVGGGTALVQEDKVACVHGALPHPKASTLLGCIRPVLLGAQSVFFARQVHALEHQVDR